VIAVDTSVIVAILKHESEEGRVRAALGKAGSGFVSAANLLELQLVLAGKPPAAWAEAEAILADYRVAIRPFDERQLRIAREAAVTFGKGRHKAGLNFGDCFAYALAKAEALPLLCTGNDFIHTDLKLA
jgi:ribonuclease VapC